MNANKLNDCMTAETVLVVQSLGTSEYLVAIDGNGQAIWNENIDEAIQYEDSLEEAISLRKTFGYTVAIIRQANR